MSYEWRERWRRRYKRHISSAKWRLTKQRLLFERGACCERCGRASALALHHKTYKRLGHEWDEDLELVCEACHPIADAQRVMNNRAQAIRRRGEISGQLCLL